VVNLEFDFEISDEQAMAFATELYYSTNLIADIKACVEKDPEAYAAFLEKERAKERRSGS